MISEENIANCESENIISTNDTTDVQLSEKSDETNNDDDIYMVEVLMANHLKPIIMYIFDLLMGFFGNFVVRL